jgi:hypothetical protein
MSQEGENVGKVLETIKKEQNRNYGVEKHSN